MTVQVHHFTSSNGFTKIHWQMWLPEKEPIALVHCLHGLNNRMKHFDELAKDLVEEGYLVFGQDMLGHGRSIEREEDRGFFAAKLGDEFVLADILYLHRHILELYPGKKSVILGHSMGSFFARRILVDYPDILDAAVLLGTSSLNRREHLIGKFYLKFVSAMHEVDYRPGYLTKIGLGFLNHNFFREREPMAWVSTDENVLEEREEEEEGWQVFPTLKLYGDLNRILGYLEQKEKFLQVKARCPVLIMYGELDPLARGGKMPKLLASRYKDAGLESVSLKSYPEARHELFSDVNRHEIFSDISVWLRIALAIG